MEYVIVEDIEKDSFGREVALVYNLFTKNIVKDIQVLPLQEIFIGPISVNVPRGDIDDFAFLGTAKNKTIIEKLPYFKVCEFLEGFENFKFNPTVWGLVDFHISGADLPYDLYPKKVNFEVLDFSDRISPAFLRQTILIEYAKYTHQELVLNEGEKEEFRYLLRKSEYFPPRNIKEINEVNNEASDLTINTTDNKNIKNMNQEKDKSVLNRTKILKFWDWFKASESALVKQYGEDLENMGAAIFEKFIKTGTESILDLEMIDKNKYVLTITAEGIKDLIPEILDIIQYVPSLIHFEVSAFQQPDLEFKEFSYEDAYKYKIDNFYFKLNPTLNNQYNLDIFIGDVDELSEDDIQVAFMFLDAQIGEYKVMTLIDEIEFHVLKDKNNLIKFSELHNYLQ